MKPATNYSYLVRFIIPASPETNIISSCITRKIIFLKNILEVVNRASAAAASKSSDWRAEIIDENNYSGPRDERGLPDHFKLQKDNIANIVVFHCRQGSVMKRASELAGFYRRIGVVTLAGGRYARRYPQKMLNNNINIVIHGENEKIIQEILATLKEGKNISGISGISFRMGGRIKTNPPPPTESNDLLPPNFRLLKYDAKKTKIFPIGNIRKFGVNKDISAFRMVNQLAVAQKARKFFIVDNWSKKNSKNIAEFFKAIVTTYGKRLKFTVQIPLETAENTELLETMKKAGVTKVIVNYESPTNKNLQARHKNYSPSQMIKWTKILHRFFSVHGVFIFGYPDKQKNGIHNRIKTLERFIKKLGLSGIQISLPKTDLRRKMNPAALQEVLNAPMNIMKWFYGSFGFLHIPVRIAAWHYFFAKWWHRQYGEIRKTIRSWIQKAVQCNDCFLLRQWKKLQEKFFSIAMEYQTGISP